jgi:hypothetical protein
MQLQLHFGDITTILPIDVTLTTIDYVRMYE